MNSNQLTATHTCELSIRWWPHPARALKIHACRPHSWNPRRLVLVCGKKLSDFWITLLKMSSRMLDWMDKTHKTVNSFTLQLTPLNLMAFSTTQASHAVVISRVGQLDWHKHKWPTITWKCMMQGWNYWVSIASWAFVTPKFQTLTMRSRHSWIMKKVPGRTHCVLPTLRLNYVNYPGQGKFPARTCTCLTQVSCGPQSVAWWKPGLEINVPNQI